MICRHLSLRFCVLALLLLLPASAYNFSKCNEFYLKTSRVFVLPSRDKVRAIHIGEGKYLAFSKENSADSAKYDPFMELIIFKGENLAQKYDLIPPKKILDSAPKLAAISENSTTQGQILRPQKSFKDFGTFSRKIPQNSVLSDICYQVYGISIGGDKFIDSAYLARFLGQKHSAYSDIAFSVSGKKINSINPIAQKIAQSSNFGAESSTQKIAQSCNFGAQSCPKKIAQSCPISQNLGDEILAIGGKKIKDEYDFFDTASTMDSAKLAQITLKRGDKILQIPARVFKKHRAFSQRASALDILGIIVDDDLRIQRTPENYKFFAKNDKILRLNQIKISNKTELDSALKEALLQGRTLSFLVVRKNFEFFISLDIMEAVF